MHMIKKLIKTLQDQLIAQMKLITNIDQLNSGQRTVHV